MAPTAIYSYNTTETVKGLRFMYYVPIFVYRLPPHQTRIYADDFLRGNLNWIYSDEIERGWARVTNSVDHGGKPFVVNINEATKQNNTFRSALWTGSHLQVTLMSISPGEDIGLEIHPDVDQFLRIEQGQGVVEMGKSRDTLDYVQNVSDDSAIMVPAGIWHNVTNTGSAPLKLYSIYSPPNHPFGTIHATKVDAMKAEE